MRKQSFSEQLWSGLGDAVADIRQKVVEEGYFGRAVTQLDVDAPQWPQAREAEPAHSIEQERERNPDLDIER